MLSLHKWKSITFIQSDNGTKQGCVLAPVPFCILCCYVRICLYWCFRKYSTGKYLQPETFHYKARISSQIIRDLLFADGWAKLAHSLENILHIDKYICCNTHIFWFNYKHKNRQSLCFRSILPVIPYPKCMLKLKTVDAVNSLGSSVTNNVKLDKGIETRIGKTSISFGKVCGEAWE